MENKVSVEQFFKVAPRATKEIVVSNRYKMDDGTPIKWKIKALTRGENAILQKKHTINGQLNAIKYQNDILVSSVVSPNLNDADLQDRFGATDANNLLELMLYVGESAYLELEVQKINGMLSLEKLVNEVKNG